MSHLADDYFCLVLDEHTGWPRISPRVAAVGLGAALLAEVVIPGHVVVTSPGSLQALDVRRPADPLAREVHELLLARPQHSDPGVWISYLARDAFDRIGDRLSRSGTVSPVRRRRLSGPRTTYLPTNLSTVAWPGIRIAQQLGSGTEISLADLTCTGLAVATGLINLILWDPDLHGQARTMVPDALALLPPPLAAVLARTEVAVADAILTRRG